MVGEWQPPEDCEITGPPGNNAVLGHVLARLFGIVSPPTVSVLIIQCSICIANNQGWKVANFPKFVVCFYEKKQTKFPPKFNFSSKHQHFLQRSFQNSPGEPNSPFFPPC